MKEKTGRNETCHCGSGAKYKKCCLPAETADREAYYTRLRTFPAPDPTVESEVTVNRRRRRQSLLSAVAFGMLNVGGLR